MNLDENIVKTLTKLLNVDEQEIIAQPLQTEVLVNDTTQKIIISIGKSALPTAFVLISAKKTPGAIKSGYEKVSELAKRVGPALAKNLLMPLEVAETNGLTYSISRYHKPLNTNLLIKKLDNWRIGRPLINWVIAVAKATKTAANRQEIETSFMQPLLALSKADGLKPAYKKIALEALDAVNNGSWQPSFICAHNDLWCGNVLSSKQHKFVLIDWDGVLLNGYAFYDLVRVAGSFGFKKTRFNHVFKQYCNAMQCNEIQAKYYLISAFAFLHSDLGGWQLERFITLLESCMDYLDENTY